MFCILQCPDRDLIFLEDVLGTIITPNGAGAFPDVTPHDIYTLIYTGNSSPTTSESTSHPILLCISSPTTFSLSPPPTCSDIHIPDNIVESLLLGFNSVASLATIVTELTAITVNQIWLNFNW